MGLKKNLINSSASHILSVNPFSSKSYLLKNDKIRALKKVQFDKSNFITSYISPKDTIFTTVGISRSIPKEDLQSVIEIKAYEDLGLDQASDYVIDAFEAVSQSEERLFHIFVAKPDNLYSSYGNISAKTKYIDLITPAPLLYQILYEKEMLVPSGVHCFISILQNDAFVSIYKDGHFLYTKSFDYSLNRIHERTCEVLGEHIDAKEFFDVLTKEGLVTQRADLQKALMKVFGELFIALNDIIIYVKRTFKIEGLDQAYLSTSGGDIVGVDDYSATYLGLRSSPLHFEHGLSSDEWHIDSIDYLLMLRALEFNKGNTSNVVNLTVFPRPPAFTKRASGQFLIAMGAAILLGLVAPLYHFGSSKFLDLATAVLTKEEAKLEAEVAKYREILSEKQKKIELLDTEVSRLSAKYKAKEGTLNAIYDKKVNYKMKSEIFYNFAKELKRFGVGIEQLENQGDKYQFSLVGSDDRRLTELIKYVSDNHFDEIGAIDIELIEKDLNSTSYKGILKVELK